MLKLMTSRRSRYLLQKYLSHKGIFIAFSAIAFIFLLNYIVIQFFSNYVPMSLFLSAVVISAWGAGSIGGVIATVIGALLEVFIFSKANMVLSDRTEQLRLIIYFTQGFFISYVFGVARTNTRHALEQLKTNQVLLNHEREVAKNANRVKSLFLAHMSHEIRTPLVAVLGFADLLKDPDLSEKQRTDYLNIIERTGNSLKDIINDILDISKVEAGHFEIDSHAFSLSEMLQEVHAVLSLKCMEKNIQLEFLPVMPVPDSIILDSRRLRQVLINLIGNSIKFTDKGSVKLTYTASEQNLIFNLEDSGIGMSEEQIPRLFENFSQGDESVSRQYAGTGLGLALSRKLARNMGGDVQLISTSVGSGSAFQIRVRFKENKKQVLTSQKIDESAPYFENKKILVVDDSADNRLLLERVLIKLGLVVHTATNGAEALTKIKSEQYDLILMDMQMPVMDGYTTARYLRKQKNTVPVIALTANAMKEDRKRCIQAGCNDYLSKPLVKEQLYQILRTHC